MNRYSVSPVTLDHQVNKPVSLTQRFHTEYYNLPIAAVLSATLAVCDQMAKSSLS
jgi:hypothetical protein